MTIVKVKVTPRPNDMGATEQIVDGVVSGESNKFNIVTILWYGIYVKFEVHHQTVKDCIKKDVPILY